MKRSDPEELVAYARDHFPSHVPVSPPGDLAEARQRADVLRERYKDVLGDFPPACDFEERILRRRRYRDHIETKLTYEAEPGDTVHAYLLVPRDGKPPFPAVVAQHQCRMDCDWGKEAVVGKVAERRDQAYGLELVRRGFVVLAPDSKNCGERFIPGLRDEGDAVDNDDHWKFTHCWDAANRHVTTAHLSAKRLFDSVRALDYCETLTDLIDPKRIGMIGHSLGAGSTALTAALDERVRVAVLSAGMVPGMGNGHGYPLLYTQDQPESGIWAHEMIELIAPRPLLVTKGREEIDANEDPQQQYGMIDWLCRYAQHVYTLSGKRENFQLHMFDAGHVFPEDVRSRAYSFIERGMTT